MRADHLPEGQSHRVCVADKASGNVDSDIPDQEIDIPELVGVESAEYVVRPNGYELREVSGPILLWTDKCSPDFRHIGTMFGDWPEAGKMSPVRVEITPNFVNCRMCVERD